jgi:hypothetical protein
MDVRLSHDRVTIGSLSIAFERTLRLPDDGRDYPLPPSFGRFPIHRVEDHAGRVPKTWLAHGGVFIPMYQREAAWLRLSASLSTPQALKVAVGMVNAVSGDPWSEAIVEGEKQDYLVCPPQPWLDGINAGDGIVRQFVAMPLGMGSTVEGQVTGEERFGGIQLVSFAPKPRRIPPPFPPVPSTEVRGAPSSNAVLVSLGLDETAEHVGTIRSTANRRLSAPSSRGAEMGIAAGGRMRQSIYPDPWGGEVWENRSTGRVYVHIVNSMLYEQITGLKAPGTPITARTYADHAYPWYDLYDEHLGDVDPSDVLADVKTVKEMDATKGFSPQQDDDSVDVPQVIVKSHVRTPRGVVADGDWSR